MSVKIWEKWANLKKEEEEEGEGEKGCQKAWITIAQHRFQESLASWKQIIRNEGWPEAFSNNCTHTTIFVLLSLWGSLVSL